MSSEFQQVTIFLNSGPYQLWQNKSDNSLHVGKFFDGPAGQYFALEPFWGEEESSEASASDSINTQPIFQAAYDDVEPMASTQAQSMSSDKELLEQQDHAFAKALADEQDKVFAETNTQPTTGSWATVASNAQPKAQAEAQPKAQLKAQPKAQPEYQHSLQENRQVVIDCFTKQINTAIAENVFAGSGSTYYINLYRKLSSEHSSECRRMIEVGEEASDFWKKRSLTPPMSVVQTTLPNWLAMTIVPSSPTRKWPLVLLHVKGFRPKIW